METGGNGARGRNDGPWTRLRENVTGIVSLLVTGLWLGAFFTGQEWWLAVLLVGYAAVVPLVAILFGDEEDRREWWDDREGESSADATGTTDTETRSGERRAETDARDALETLRERYAAGELTDEQFERKLDRLLNTETIEDAAEWSRDRDDASARRSDPDRDRGREGNRRGDDGRGRENRDVEYDT